jgi:hypothetical protein
MQFEALKLTKGNCSSYPHSSCLRVSLDVVKRSRGGTCALNHRFRLPSSAGRQPGSLPMLEQHHEPVVAVGHCDVRLSFPLTSPMSNPSGF